MRRTQLVLLLLIAVLLLAACGGEVTPTRLLSTATPAAVITAGPTATAVPQVAGPFQPPPLPIPVLSAQQVGATPLKQAWKAGLEENSPAEIIGEANDLVFIKTVSGGLYALSIKDGTLTWKQNPPLAGPTPTAAPTATAAPSVNPAPPEPQPQPRAPFAAVVSSTVMLGDPSAENIRAYDTKTGQKKWETPLRFDVPNRDPGTRFLPGGVYGDTLVVSVSSKVNPFANQAGAKPEYLQLSGFDISSGQLRLSFLPSVARPDAVARLGNVIYGSKLIVVEGPDGATYALDPKTGAVLWQALGLLLLPSSDPDVLYSLAPQPRGKVHNPIVTKVDITNSRPLWQKTLDLQISSDQPIAFSPDEKTAYIAVFASPQKSFLWTFSFDTNEIRQTDTSAYGLYDMLPTNEGVYLVQSSPRASGLVYLELGRDRPSYALGGVVELLFGPQASPEKNSFFVTFRDEARRGYFFGVNNRSGQVLSTNALELPTAPPYFSPSQKLVYLVAGETKPQIYALVRP